ncbi:MAG: hypothetical protein NC092_06875, partial [Butyrivibrio sp.]|nr:hypothetical protein [Butyrivibrio sp.]
YVFCSYLIGLLPKDAEEPIDLDGKLKLEYYKLQKTFQGEIALEEAKTVYVPAKHKAVKGMDEKTPLDEVIAKINEKFKGNFTEGDKVILSALRDKLLSDKKLKKMAQSSDPQIFVESIFPKAFGAAAQDGYVEAQESYQSLFEDTAKYNAIMSALAEVVYREMRKKGIKRAEGSEAYTYEMPQGLSMAAEDQGVYGDREEQK